MMRLPLGPSGPRSPPWCAWESRVSDALHVLERHKRLIFTEKWLYGEEGKKREPEDNVTIKTVKLCARMLTLWRSYEASGQLWESGISYHLSQAEKHLYLLSPSLVPRNTILKHLNFTSAQIKISQNLEQIDF